MKKILVIGGACQGKSQWAENTFPQYNKINIDNVLSEEEQGYIKIDDFHIVMKNWLLQKADYKENVKNICSQNSWIIISNEVGSGIIPMEKNDRLWREETGRMLTFIAGEADEIYRIFCGIPVKIK